MERLIEHRNFAKENPRENWTADHTKAKRQATMLDLIGKTSLTTDGKGNVIYTETLVSPPGADPDAEMQSTITHSVNRSLETGWKEVDIRSMVDWAKTGRSKEDSEALIKATINILAADETKKNDYHTAWADLKKIICG